jgi:DNA-binding winged helix-turn-helix (wHTH) protein/tetratricopeptide (TPR) repeat protein/TolB-like protein
MIETPGYAFGPFRLFPARRLLLRGETAVTLTPKAFDTLVALVERREHVVSREELLDHLWPGLAVEEGNLTQQVFLLRKALDDSGGGEAYIATVPRRGYRFVGDVTVLQPATDHSPRPLIDQPRSPRRPRTWRLGLVAAAVVAAWWWWPRTSSSSVDTPDRVAVLPFSYRGAVEHASLAESMVDLLSRTLDGAGRLQTVEPRGVMGILSQHRKRHESRGIEEGFGLGEAEAVATQVGAGRYVAGEIVEAGGRVRISARLYRVGAESEPIAASVEGHPDDLFALTDSLTAQLAVGETTRSGEGLPTTAMRTSGTIGALKAFLRGEQLFRAQPSSQTRRVDAYKEYSRAVDLDQTFALAWFRRSQLAYFSGQALARVTDFAEAAHRHRDDLPWRQRRLVEANHAYASGAARESLAAFRDILKTHPDDVEALFGVALLGAEYGWLLGGPVNSYRRDLEAFLRYQPDDFMGLWLLRNLEAQEGRCVEADSLTARIFPAPLPHRAIGLFCGPESRRRDEFLQGLRVEPIGVLRLSRQWVNSMSRNPRGALAIGRLIDERGESTAVDLLSLAELELTLGRLTAARREFDRLEAVHRPWALADSVYWMLAPHVTVERNKLFAWRTSLESWEAGAEPELESVPRGQGPRHDGVHRHLQLYLLARIDARRGDYEAALQRATELEQLTAPGGAGSISLDLAQAIRAHVFEAQGRLEDALRTLEAAPRTVPFSRRNGWVFRQPQERYLRAEILNRLGRFADALASYQSVQSVLAGPSSLRQAEMHERLGQPQQAAEQYRRFIELWRDCDEELRPLVDGAARALQRLAK